MSKKLYSKRSNVVTGTLILRLLTEMSVKLAKPFKEVASQEIKSSLLQSCRKNAFHRSCQLAYCKSAKGTIPGTSQQMSKKHLIEVYKL